MLQIIAGSSTVTLLFTLACWLRDEPIVDTIEDSCLFLLLPLLLVFCLLEALPEASLDQRCHFKEANLHAGSVLEVLLARLGDLFALSVHSVGLHTRAQQCLAR